MSVSGADDTSTGALGKDARSTLTVVVGSVSLALNTACVAYLHHAPRYASAPRIFCATADAVANIVTGLALVCDGVLELRSGRYSSSCSRLLFLLWTLLVALSSALLRVAPALELHNAALDSVAPQDRHTPSRKGRAPPSSTLTRLVCGAAWSTAAIFFVAAWAGAQLRKDAVGESRAFEWRHEPTRQARDLVQNLWQYNSERNDWSADYRENFVIGLVQGLVSGNLTGEQLAVLDKHEHFVANQRAENPSQHNGNASTAQASSSSPQRGQNFPSSAPKQHQKVKDLLLGMGIANEAIEKIFKSATLNENNTAKVETNASQVETESHGEDIEVNIRTEIPILQSNQPEGFGGVPLTNTSLLYQMIQRLNNNSNLLGVSEEPPPFLDLRPNDATESSSFEHETVTVLSTSASFEDAETTTQESEPSQSVESTTTDHELPKIQEAISQDYNNTESNTQQHIDPFESESTTLESNVSSTRSPTSSTAQDNEVKTCYLKTNFTRGFTTAVFLVMFCTPVLVVLAVNSHSLELLMSQKQSKTCQAARPAQAWSEGTQGENHPRETFAVSSPATALQRKLQSSVVRDTALAVTYIVFWLPLLIERLVYSWQHWKCLSSNLHTADFLFILALSHTMLRAIYYVMDDIKQRATTLSIEPCTTQAVQLTRHAPLEENHGQTQTRNANPSTSKSIEPLTPVMPV